jgi:hypothetical protein
MNAERECSLDEGVRGHQCVTRIENESEDINGTKGLGSNSIGDCSEGKQR